VTARQAHGFKNESKVIKDNNLIDVRGYTAKWDAKAPCVRASGRLYYNVPDQIKTIRQGGSVDMGDVFRHAKTDENFILHVDFYDKKDKDNILESHILYVDIEKWKEFFKFDGYEFLRECLVDISNEYSDDARWKQMMSEMKTRWGTRPVHLAPKRDHKKQKRIQCTIPNAKFYNEILPMFAKAEYV